MPEPTRVRLGAVPPMIQALVGVAKGAKPDAPVHAIIKDLLGNGEPNSTEEFAAHRRRTGQG